MIYLAPIQGITDQIYRRLFSVYFQGVDLAVAPFISASKKRKSLDKLLSEVCPENNSGIPTLPQIMSSDPEDFIRLANALYDVGCETVNWNIGCPFSIVVKKGRGAGILCHPDRVESFLDRTVSSIKPKLSIKLRIGFKKPDEVLQLIPVFNRYPLEELMIHPRTAVQMYGGEVDLDMFEKCLALSRHRIVYNGDVDSVRKLEMLSKRFASVERWMIGRGLIANPFLAEKIKFNTDKPRHEQIKIMKAFHDHLFDEYVKILSGPSHITNRMKEIWAYMAFFFEDGEKIRKKINKTHHRDHYVDVVNKIFDELS